jgi:hypothetical protein
VTDQQSVAKAVQSIVELAEELVTENPDFTKVPWRVGRSIGRTIYAIVDEDADRKKDIVVGMMDTRELAEEAVVAHNERLSYLRLKDWRQ